MNMRPDLHVGDKVRFHGEGHPYKIRARSSRYLICTKPFNLKKTVIYTIVDLFENVRGAENLIFGMGAETDADCEAMLERIESGQSAISHRNRVELRWAWED